MTREKKMDPPGQPQKTRQPQPDLEKQAPFRMPKIIPCFLGLGLLAVVAVLILNALNRADADYEVILLTEKSCTEEQIEALSRVLVAYGEDVNGDGRIAAGVTPVNGGNRAAGTPPYVLSDDAALKDALARGTGALLITDRFAYQSLRVANINLFAALDGTPLEAFPERGDTAVFWPLKDLNGSEGEGKPDILSPLTLSVGAPAAAAKEGGSTDNVRYLAAIDLADRMKRGETTNQPAIAD